MTEQPAEEKYYWIILFKSGGRLYPYLFRTVPYMTQVIKKYCDEHGGTYPFRVWVIVDNEIQKVVIT